MNESELPTRSSYSTFIVKERRNELAALLERKEKKKDSTSRTLYSIPLLR